MTDQPEGEEPWGFLALIQLVGLSILAILIQQSLSEISIQKGNHQQAFLLHLAQVIQTVNTRLDKSFEPWHLKSFGLDASVGVWGLGSTLSNTVSALTLFYICARPSQRSGHWRRVLTLVFSIMAIVVSILATPFIFSGIVDNNGRTYLSDISLIALLLFTAYFLTDLFSLFNANQHERSNFRILIFSVDIPCLITTAIFLLYNVEMNLSPVFTIGVSAAVFVLYSLSFLLLCILFWSTSPSGRQAMEALKGSKIFIIVIGAALNGTIGCLIQLVKLPIYLDLVGTLLLAMLFGPIEAVLSAILGTVFVGVTTTPITIAYVGTSIGVALAACGLKKFGYGRSFWKTLLFGTLVLGPLSTILSVPITTYLFGGVTLVGGDYITALLHASGMSLLASVASGAFVFDAVDKGLASAMAYAVFKRAPKRLKQAA